MYRYVPVDRNGRRVSTNTAASGRPVGHRSSTATEKEKRQDPMDPRMDKTLHVARFQIPSSGFTEPAWQTVRGWPALCVMGDSAIISLLFAVDIRQTRREN